MCNLSSRVVALFLFLVFFFKNSVSSQSNSEEFSRLLENSEIVISLRNYTVSNPDGESVDSLYILSPYSKLNITVTDNPADAHFVVVQVHSYLVNVFLSLDEVAISTNSITGTNVGLLKNYKGSDLKFYLTYNSSAEEAYVMVSVQAYPDDAPIPGGCNMEFQVEVSPFLVTIYDSSVTEVSFAPPSPPSSVLSEIGFLPSSECNMKPFPVEHKMYYQYLPERDFTKETYFGALKSMMTKGRILQNGFVVPNKLTSSPMKKVFATYPGTGRAYAVISSTGNFSSVYVPSFTYGCSELESDNTCDVLNTIFSKVLCASILFMGLFTCFFGHFFFRMEIFFFGFLVTGIFTYISVSILFNEAIALTSAVSLGVFTSAGMVIAFTFIGLPILSIVLATLTFGFLLASLIFYPITDYVDLFVFDINYWGIFIGILATCPVIMLCLAEKANIISCALVGSYMGITSIDHYLGSNLRYIVINTIRRATNDKFRIAVTAPPFQLNDIILTVAWFSLTLIGNWVQRRLMKSRPPFPPPENVFRRWKKLRRSQSIPTNERTPLVSNRVPGSYIPPNYFSSYYDGN